MEHRYADVVLHQALSSVLAQYLQTEREAGGEEMDAEGRGCTGKTLGISAKGIQKQLDVYPMGMKELKKK